VQRTARRRRERVATSWLASWAKRASMTPDTRPSIISDSSPPRFLIPSTCVFKTENESYPRLCTDMRFSFHHLRQLAAQILDALHLRMCNLCSSEPC